MNDAGTLPRHMLDIRDCSQPTISRLENLPLRLAIDIFLRQTSRAVHLKSQSFNPDAYRNGRPLRNLIDR